MSKSPGNHLFNNLKSREIISISGLRLPLHHTEPSASLLSLKDDGLCPAAGKAQLYPNYLAVSASYAFSNAIRRISRIFRDKSYLIHPSLIT